MDLCQSLCGITCINIGFLDAFINIHVSLLVPVAQELLELFKYHEIKTILIINRQRNISFMLILNFGSKQTKIYNLASVCTILTNT